MIDLLENRADPMILRISSGLDFIELHANAKNYKSEQKYFGQIIEKYIY